MGRGVSARSLGAHTFVDAALIAVGISFVFRPTHGRGLGDRPYGGGGQVAGRRLGRRDTRPRWQLCLRGEREQQRRQRKKEQSAFHHAGRGGRAQTDAASSDYEQRRRGSHVRGARHWAPPAAQGPIAREWVKEILESLGEQIAPFEGREPRPRAHAPQGGVQSASWPARSGRHGFDLRVNE